MEREDIKQRLKTKLEKLDKEQVETKLEELDKELNRLNEFNQSDGVSGTDPVQKLLLDVHSDAMSIYLECLKERLARC